MFICDYHFFFVICFAFDLDSKSIHSSLPKGLRTVASSEPHSALQYFLFLYAKKQDELFKYQDVYVQLAKESKETLDSWEKQLISPMKILIQDHEKGLKKKKLVKQSSMILPGPVLTASINNSPATATPDATAPSGDEELSGADQLTTGPIVNGDILNQLLPIHAKLFEKHRVASMKRLFRSVLWNEITYHARCLEAYSHLMECLDIVEDVEENNADEVTTS